MVSRKSRIFKTRDGEGTASSSKALISHIGLEELARRERYFEFFAAGVLLVFGIYHSILYFGHTVVPISDFPPIVRVGRELLSFNLPGKFKVAPVTGILQAILSYFIADDASGLKGGWLLNALLHPLNLVLFWLVGREIVGKSAIWFAVVAILNPWVMYMLTEPLIEIPLLFFSLLTLYSIFKGWRCRYALASITTLVRYEGAALILAIFVMDMIQAKSKKERIRSFLYSALAAVPLAIWMLGTVFTWKSGTSHYFNVFTKDYAAKGFTDSVEGRTGVLLHMKLLWSTGIQPLLILPLKMEKSSWELLWNISKITAIISFFFGAIYGLLKKNWKILMLLIFFVPYFLLHARYPYPLQRFHTNIFWIVLLISLFGFQGIWRLIDGKGRVPKWVVLILQGLAGVSAAIWIAMLFPSLPKISQISPPSSSVPYTAMSVVFLIFIGRVFVYKGRYALRELSIFLLLCLIILSNQFWLVRRVGDGQKEKEFKLLADWCVANLKEDEKLGVYMAGMVRMFAPDYAERIVGPPFADNPSEFVNECYKRDITYVVWATREGIQGRHTGYTKANLPKTIAHLRNTRNMGPYQFITQVGTKRGYVNIFRLRRPAKAISE